MSYAQRKELSGNRTLAIIIVATVFLVLRLVSKWGVTRKANADDYVVIVGWIFAVGLSVSIMIGTHVGLGAPDSGEQVVTSLTGPAPETMRTMRT